MDMRVGLIIEYDGSAFYGSQLQTPEQRTVQGELETCIHKLYRTPIRADFAGRTDKHVHASGQVVAYTPTKFFEPQTIFGALNDSLPKDIKIKQVQYVPAQFDPRRDAITRTYVYRISNSVYPPVIRRNHIAHFRHPLNTDLIKQAAQCVVGEHDFIAFAGPATLVDASTVRNVKQLTLAKDGHNITIRITANAFLHQQVRRIVGALVAIGTDRLEIEAFRELIAHGHKAGWTVMAPANGLELEQITYLDDTNKLPQTILPLQSQKSYNE